MQCFLLGLKLFNELGQAFQFLPLLVAQFPGGFSLFGRFLTFWFLISDF